VGVLGEQDFGGILKERQRPATASSCEMTASLIMAAKVNRLMRLAGCREVEISGANKLGNSITAWEFKRTCCQFSGDAIKTLDVLTRSAVFKSAYRATNDDVSHLSSDRHLRQRCHYVVIDSERREVFAAADDLLAFLCPELL
jgi:hypothetical protein